MQNEFIECKGFFMGKIIGDLWILTEYGLTVFSRVNGSKIDDQIFGGLMSALNAFAQSLSEGGMTNFEVSNMRFTILKNNHLLFVANSSKQVKSKKVLNELKIISKKFNKEFSEEDIHNNYGNIRIFDNFEHHIKDSLEDSITK